MCVCVRMKQRMRGECERDKKDRGRNYVCTEHIHSNSERNINKFPWDSLPLTSSPKGFQRPPQSVS